MRAVCTGFTNGPISSRFAGDWQMFIRVLRALKNCSFPVSRLIMVLSDCAVSLKGLTVFPWQVARRPIKDCICSSGGWCAREVLWILEYGTGYLRRSFWYRWTLMYIPWPGLWDLHQDVVPTLRQVLKLPVKWLKSGLKTPHAVTLPCTGVRSCRAFGLLGFHVYGHMGVLPECPLKLVLN